MKIKYLRFKNWLLMGAMGLLGMQACTDRNERGQRLSEPEPVLEYGVRVSKYEVKGKVVDDVGQPIKGLQVIPLEGHMIPDSLPETEDWWQEWMRRESDTTDAQGSFELVSMSPDRPCLMVRDIDGKKNGSYEDQVADVDWTDSNGEVTVKMKTKKK